jgi:hypothetical protein
MAVEDELGYAYEAAQTAAVWETVRCEKCKEHYHYEKIRRGVGGARKGWAGLSLPMTLSAEQRAEKLAAYRLMRALERGIDVVPCPSCGWVQGDMVREMKRSTARGLIWLAWLVVIVGLMYGAYQVGSVLFDAEVDVDALKWRGAAWAALAGVVGGLVLWGVRRRIVSAVDPNAGGAKGATFVVGGPVGRPGKPPRGQVGVRRAAVAARIIEEESERVSEFPRDPVLDYRRTVVAGGDMVVQLEGLMFPAVCCSCLAGSEVLEPFKYGTTVEISVPLCQTCARRYRAKRRKGLALTTAVLFGLGIGLLLWAWPHVSVRQRLRFAMGCVLFAAFAPVIWMWLGRRWASPVKLWGFDPVRNTVRMRFVNSEFAGILEHFLRNSHP